MKETTHTTYIITPSDENNWITEKEVENILTQSFSKTVLLNNEEDKNLWVEISNEEKEKIENEINKIKGYEETINE